MALRTIPTGRSAFALALVFSTAAHAAIATSSRSRTPAGTEESVPVVFEVDVEPAADDPPGAPLSNAHDDGATSPVSPARARPAPSRRHAVVNAPPGDLPEASQPAEPSALLGTPAETPRFALSLSSARPSGDGATPGGGGPAPGLALDAEALPEREVDVPARLKHGETPRYPPDALVDAIEGDVQLELIVSRAGDVESVKVVAPAGHRFDEEAVASAGRFRFAPAVKDGRPVRARVRWTVAFRLR
jgi:TonB family protein